jgi:hypothetical protein
MATPLVRIPQSQGGTMYAFASSAKDMTRAFNNPDIKFEFSKFALLDLPDFTTAVSGSNTIDFELNLKQASGSNYVATAPNVDFAQSFQNYALNMEELLLQDDDYDPIILQSDSEKIFFKWLSSLGAIRLTSADSNISTLGGYVEPANSDGIGVAAYDRVVKYLGTIDAENDVAYSGNTYHEVFINVPTSVGYTPQVIFSPSNYNTTATKLYADDDIEGRAGQTHPDPNLNLATIVDDHTISDGPFYNIAVNSTDSVQLEWDDFAYSEIVNAPSVKNLSDYSKTGQQFTFNAILVYYDMYSQSVPSNRSTNLYGILILDDIQSVGGTGSKINEQIKNKPNEVTGLNGNAFSLKLNLKFNSSLDNVGVETSINDFTTFSMDLFMDTTTALENAVEVIVQANNRYSSIATKVEELEGLLLSNVDSSDITTRLKSLETDFENASIQLADSDSLLKLIQKAHEKINSLIDGTIPTELQYNTDVIFNGKGTTVDKTAGGHIKINNTVVGYAQTINYLWDLASSTVGAKLDGVTLFDAGLSGSGAQSQGIWTRLQSYTNRMSLYETFTSSKPNDDLYIYIDDSTVAWQSGQVFKIAFDTIDMDGHNIIIKTGKTTGFDKTIIDIDSGQLLTTKPYIEITCVDSVNYKFEADILR